jgi:hypothetical protein
MSSSASKARTLLAGCLAGVGLAFAASSASAEVYQLSFSTGSQTGVISFIAPAAGSLPGAISSVVGYETTTGTIGGGNQFLDSGKQQTIGSLETGFVNITGATNTNQFLSFVPNIPGPPPQSNDASSWFNGGGLAVQAADGAVLDFFLTNTPNGPKLSVETYDLSTGNYITADGSASLLTDLGAPGPTPGSGLFGLYLLAFGAAALKLKERFAR